MRTSTGFAVVFVVLLASTAVAQDAITTARDLYASAEYEAALAAFSRVTVDPNNVATAEVDRYRVLCLIALGRASEADQVIESIVSKDPFYQPAAADASPRVRAAFSAVRQRALPGVVRSLYIGAKAAFDRKAYAEAALALDKTVKVIDNLEGAQRAELDDLRILASGFLDLSRAAMAPPPAAAAPKPEPLPPPAVALPTTGLVVLKQDLPPLPFSLASLGQGEFRGVVEVDIDEAGKVTNVRIVQAVHVLYDPLLLNAAREWKYEAPRVGGKPTTSRKRVEVVLRP